jgi:hypothetical protein
MAIDSVSSASESVPNQEEVSVTRADDGSLSISISVDASAMASADGESSSDSVTGAEQAESDMDGTDTSYPTDQAGQDDSATTHDKALMAAMEDLLATIDEAIELLGGQSGIGTADGTQPVGGETPVVASQTATAGNHDTELVQRLEGLAADLEEMISGLSGGEEPMEPFGPGNTNVGEQFVDIYLELSVPEGRMEIIDLLSSGEFGEDGKKIAELLPNMTGVNGEEFWNQETYFEIRDILVESEDAEGIIAAIESISE